MTNLEGITKKLLQKHISEDKILNRLLLEFKTFKNHSDQHFKELGKAIIEETKNNMAAVKSSLSNNDDVISKLLDISNADVSMGEAGVGCRGRGDFYVHKLLTKLSKTSNLPFISADSLDDTGAIIIGSSNEINPNHKNNHFISDFKKDKIKNGTNEVIILTKMEGMHSRLSDFPFLAGFHVTRAALRDIYVKGGIPLSLMVDVHLADDGDIGSLFDYQAGIATVAELANVPITAGSTLRIGGDMVIGDRLTGGVSAIGIMNYSFFRKNIQEGDIIMMTEGAGGGTISTTAIYSGIPSIVKQTINIKFLKACETLFSEQKICQKIHCMTDVTNGGLRGDLYEINEETGLGVKIYTPKVKSLVNEKVLCLLNQNSVDYLGVSLDSLLIFCEPAVENIIKSILNKKEIKVSKIGKVIQEKKVIFIDEENEECVLPKFRESAYTKIKKKVGEETQHEKQMYSKIEKSFEQAESKKEFFIKYLK